MYHTHLVYYSHYSSQVHFLYEGDDRTCVFPSYFSYLYLSPVLPMCCGYLLLLNLIFVLCKKSQSLECLKPETPSKYFLCRAPFHPDVLSVCISVLHVMFYECTLEQCEFNAFGLLG